MLNHDQNELLAQFRSGDRAAFEQVFRLYLKPLRLNAFLILRNEQESEDLVQQLFLDIWNQQLYRNIQKSLKAYLHTAIKHRCLNYLKNVSRQTKNLHEYAGQLEINTTETDELPSPQLLTVLDGLPVQQLKAFHLIHMDNKRYQEAAEEMGISINSLKSHLKLAVKFVRIKLKASPIHPYNK
ncbi:RNA polymerase sigma factor [Flavitalea sp.]|nr:sigma-70 family RNA polymerase sigma factor [Flavitalea sp.]